MNSNHVCDKLCEIIEDSIKSPDMVFSIELSKILTKLDIEKKIIDEIESLSDVKFSSVLISKDRTIHITYALSPSSKIETFSYLNFKREYKIDKILKDDI